MWYLVNILQFVFILALTLGSASGGMLLYLLTIRQPTPLRWASKIWSVIFMAVCGVRLEIAGKEHIERGQVYIFVGNHSSYVDIPVAFYTLPRTLYFIAKKELKKIPLMGWYMSLVGMIFIDRQNREKAYQSLKEAGKLVRQGKNVISFPEGTRSKDGRIGMFKRGTFALSQSSGVPIIPMAIHGADRVWPAGGIRIRPGKIKVTIGPPIYPEEFKEDELNQFAEKVRNQVVQMHEGR